MVSILLKDKNINNFNEALTKLSKTSESIIILSCDDNNFCADTLDTLLKTHDIPIIGGIFPAIVYQNKRYDQGTILLGLNNTLEVTTLHNISQDKDYDDVIEKNLGMLREDINTMFLFFDGISKNIDNIIQGLFNNFGLSINYIGGSAAGKDFLKKPVLFSNHGLLEDSALIATSTSKSTIGVKHGWEAIHEDIYQITKSDGNIIHELDYQPAFDVYISAIESYEKEKFDTNNFFKKAKHYPFGINRISGDRVVRVPMETMDNRAIICTGDITENSYVQILHADHDQLVSAAHQALKLSQKEHLDNSFNLYIGCLARLLVMEENHDKELNAIYQPEELLVGALSVGEIANNQDHYLELYNATAVVAKISDA